MTGRTPAIGVAVVMVAVLAGCGGGSHGGDVCANADGALSTTGFVFAQAPRSGERVSSGFRVAGCSSTYEANVTWRLLARDGHMLARGFTQGGSVGPGPFAFSVRYSIAGRQIGHLEIEGGEGATPPEGFPPPMDTVPLVLEP